MDQQALDPVLVQEVLSKQPFVTVEGTYNVRDLHHTDAHSVFPSCSCTSGVKPGLLFRSGELSALTDRGSKQLHALGVRAIYDLRSDPEMRKYGSTRVPDLGPDVAFVRVPVFRDVDYSPENMVKRYKLYASGKDEAFMQLYSEILESAGPAFCTVMLHIRDRPTAPLLFNCTAGKDRTGVLAALLLRLANVQDTCIAQDYALTRWGREPARQQVMDRLRQEPMFAEDNEQMQNMFQCRAETMHLFLHLLDEKYGGADGYLISHAGLSKEDIDTIRRNITAS